MHLNLSADEVLSSTRAVRKRLDFDRPVEREVLEECLHLALQAPSGSNAQGWQFLVVTDPAQRAALAEVYKKAFAIYESSGRHAGTAYQGDDTARLAVQGRVMDSATYLARNFERVPAMLIPCHPGRFEGAPAATLGGVYGSVLPATWSFMLAARERGLGTAWTSLHLMFEEEAAEVLGIPYDQVTQMALITVGYSQGTDFKPAPRVDLDTVVHWESW
jgi:nitroreductase